MGEFEGKVALVTGGGASIGLDIVRGLLGEGASVVVADIKADEAFSNLGAKALYVPTDITSDTDLEALVRTVKDRFGRLDVLVNCAASYRDNGAASSRADWLATLDVNVASAAILTELFRPLLAAAKGAVINISSISAFAAQTGRWTYPVSKAAILQLTRQQALDYAEDGIRVNTLVAGWTWSDPIRGLSGGDQVKADAVASEFHILGRVGRGEEVANGVLFLASPRASFMTGGELKVEGGYLALGPEQRTPAIAKLTGGSGTVQ